MLITVENMVELMEHTQDSNRLKRVQLAVIGGVDLG